MTRLIAPLLMIIVAVAVFFRFTDPIFAGIKTLQDRQITLNEGLNNAKKLRGVMAGLLDQRNAMSETDLNNLNKLLPDNVDNVRLIIDINNIAKPYGMSIKGLKIKMPEEKAEDSVTRDKNNAKQAMVVLSFSTSGDYNQFQSFLSDLSQSLRLVDVSVTGFNSNEKGVYDYHVAIQTYWLK